MKTDFNPETLEGISYVLFVHPNTGEKSVASWPDDGKRTHQNFLEKYPNVEVLALGTMDYNAKDDVWLPYFENGCDRKRSEDERMAEMTFVAQVLRQRYDDNPELKSQLGKKFEKKINSSRKSLVESKLPNHIIDQKIKELRTMFK